MVSSQSNMDIEKKSDVQRSKRRQFVAVLLANLASTCAGTTLGWTSPALPLLQGETNTTLPLLITEEEGSWISGLLPIGALVGAIPAGYLADAIGRRTFLLTSAAPCLLGWLLVIFADDSLISVYCGRFIAGLEIGAATVAIPFYSEEIAEPSIRGTLGAFLDFTMCLGVLWVYIFGAFLPYLWFTIVCSIIPVVFVLTFFWMPESPIYLISKGRISDAEKSLTWLRNGGPDYDVKPELQQLIRSFKESSQSKEKLSFMVKVKNILADFSLTSPTARAVMVVFGLMIFQQAVGINAFIFYTVQIFHDAGSSLSPNICTIIVGVIQSASEFSAAMTVDRLGRKPLLLMSSTFMSVCLAGMSVYFFLRDGGSDISAWTWLPVVLLNVYIFAFAMAFGPLPWLMMAELVPASAKDWAGSFSVCLNWTLVFVVTKEFPSMVNVLGGAGAYGFFCIMAVLSGLFVAFLVPETKGKTREEIIQGWQKKT